MPPANRVLLRAINRSQVLNTIRTHGPISRADIARVTGLSQATVTTITAELINEGLILEKQTGNSTGGRPPILLDLNPESLYVVGLKLTEHYISAALTNIRADVITNLTIPASGETHSVEWVVDFVEEAVERSLTAAGVGRGQLAGVGIGMAGVIDSVTGECRYSPFFQWQDVPFRQLVEERLRVPVYVDNDVNTLTMAEQWFGHGRDVDDFLVITIGRGIGMGIVVNGQFYRGAGGGAGELGHTVIDPEGPLCDCGKHGCLETYVSDGALVRQARDALQGEELTIEEMVARASDGEPALQAIFKRAGHVLGVGVANMVNIFDPARIIITGEGTRAGALLFDPMLESIERHTFNGLAEDVEIVIQEWGDEAWARGAASLVLRELYKSPIHKVSR